MWVVVPDGCACPVCRRAPDVRFFVLVLSSWLMIGSYYCYDNPSALQDQLRLQFHNPKDFDLYFNLLCVTA